MEMQPAYRNLLRASGRRCVYPLYRFAASIKGGFTIPSRRRIVRWKDTRPCSSISAPQVTWRMYAVFVKISSAFPSSLASPLQTRSTLDRCWPGLRDASADFGDFMGRALRRARIARTLAERSDREKARRARIATAGISALKRGELAASILNVDTIYFFPRLALFPPGARKAGV